MVDLMTILSAVAASLAITLSELAKKLSSSPAEVREAMTSLIERNWVKARELNKGNEVLYTITGDGVKELEKTTRKGISALF